jgi:hypothetical protein
MQEAFRPYQYHRAAYPIVFLAQHKRLVQQLDVLVCASWFAAILGQIDIPKATLIIAVVSWHNTTAHDDTLYPGPVKWFG